MGGKEIGCCSETGPGVGGGFAAVIGAGVVGSGFVGVGGGEIGNVSVDGAEVVGSFTGLGAGGDVGVDKGSHFAVSELPLFLVQARPSQQPP